jgi:uncharacterized protein GlcG (DUF336 family)
MGTAALVRWYIHTSLFTFPGGVIIKNAEEEVIGIIGVSGSVVENDHAMATAGATSVR